MAEVNQGTGEGAAPGEAITGAGEAGTPAAPAPAPSGGNETAAGGETGTGTTQEQPGTGSGQGTGTQRAPRDQMMHMLVMFAAIALLFYFLLIRPQRKREQAQKDMLGRLKKGDKVMTGAGIVGEVVKIGEHDAILKIDPRKDVQMRVRRAAIVGLVGDAEAESQIGEGGAQS
jgi:preprotein translocase subunit YajC